MLSFLPQATIFNHFINVIGVIDAVKAKFFVTDNDWEGILELYDSDSRTRK